MRLNKIGGDAMKIAKQSDWRTAAIPSKRTTKAVKQPAISNQLLTMKVRCSQAGFVSTRNWVEIVDHR